MQAVEREFIRECLRDSYRILGFSKLANLKSALIERRYDPELAHKYVYGHAFKDRKDDISETALAMLSEHREKVLVHLAQSVSPSAAAFLGCILRDHPPAGRSLPRRRLGEIVADNWDRTFAKGNHNLLSGVYQTFRRYKPPHRVAEEGGVEGPAGPTDVIMCELIYVDSEAMEGVLVTSEGNVYWGVLHINHDGTLYGIFQRPKEDSTGILNRFYAVHVKRSGRNRFYIYSGLYIKTGDETLRPVGGESLFVWLKPSDHEALYQAMKELFGSEFEFRQVTDRPAIMDYVSGSDGEDDEVARISDFPLIAEIANPSDGGVVLFREPSRAVKSEVLEQRARQQPLPYFRRANPADSAQPSA